MDLSAQNLCRIAGLDPWEEANRLADANPAEITALAKAFADAGKDANLAADLGKEASELAGEGYRLEGTAVADVEKEVTRTTTALGLDKVDKYVAIARLLDEVSDALEGALATCKSGIANLEGGLRKFWAHAQEVYELDGAFDPFLAAQLEHEGGDLMRSLGKPVVQAIYDYEGVLAFATRRMSDLGYTVNTDLVDEREAAPGRKSLEDILREYQVAEDPGGVVMWPLGILAKIVTPVEMTATEALLMTKLLSEIDGPLELLRMKNIKEEAQERASEIYKLKDPHNEHGDAFRHAYWNAMMTREFGADFSRSFGTAHEGAKSPTREVAMDLHNNEVGRRIALANPGASDSELAGLIQRAVERGEMVVLDKWGNLEYSDRVRRGTVPGISRGGERTSGKEEEINLGGYR